MVSLTQALSIEKNSHFRDFSFSSYLNPSEEVFLRKLVETSKIPNSTITIQKENAYIGKKKEEYGEIDVFGAEKYFNEGEDEEIIDNQQVKIDHLKNQFRTPSVHSQSSWNSRSALLQGGQKNLIHNKNSKRRQCKSLLYTLSCYCSCGDKNSVDIHEHKTQKISRRNFMGEVDLDRNNKSLINPRIMEEMQMKKIKDFEIEFKKEDCFAFPIVNPTPDILETKKLVFQVEEDEKKRKPLEVFGSLILEKRNESIFDNKLDLFVINTNIRRDEIEYPPNSDGNFDDFGSDTSSDLFEIESFSTSNNSNPHLVRRASNVSSCVTPTTCYAPSEASIEWSVVTASAADFSLDYRDASFREVENAQQSILYKNGKELEKRRSGILSGCKSQKAVRVVGDAYMTRGKVVSDTREGHK